MPMTYGAERGNDFGTIEPCVTVNHTGTILTLLSFHQTDDYVAGLLTEEENAELLRLLNKLREALK